MSGGVPAAATPPWPVPLRVGGIDYLNALPLTRYLEGAGDPPLEISSHVPGVLARMLRGGELDVALVPGVEYLARREYRILPGIAIASYGEVRSILLFHRREIADVSSVGLDTCSRTSAALTRLLFRDLWRTTPELRQVEPRDALEALAGEGGRAETGELDAVLLIGDAALAARPSPRWQALDLGAVWTSWTGLPLVYAFWVWRGGPAPRGLTARFQEARTRGFAHIDDIVREYCGLHDANPASCRHYLYRTIQYDFDELHQEGLLELWRRLEAHQLLPDAVRRLNAGKGILEWLDESA